MTQTEPSHPHRDFLNLYLVLYALADPSRLRMVRHLVSAKEIATQSFPVKAARGTIAHHLKVLREAGVTRTRIEGNRRWVSLRQDDLEARFPGLLGAILHASAKSAMPHNGQ
jgi:DNA-binding transcriptional ArsR family regulator